MRQNDRLYNVNISGGEIIYGQRKNCCFDVNI